ncbi:unnamed protein product [Adineta steineri]|uniref:Transferrin receptor-like dimerisation domain-containing protein n=1 Tax=Adineta steineri TaxID=433720 RepID=A0A819J4E1_9BILA|nr:unnamed protein product [Adineta steineri]CAF3927259.1 unnamed protein product [Adineta steineri]
MRQLGTEERAALLLTADDDDNNDEDDHELNNSQSKISNDNFPTIAKRPRTYHRHNTSGTHPMLCFTLVLGAFILGCISGVVIMLYRVSQDAEPGHSLNIPQQLTNVDLSIRTKLFESIKPTNFMNLNYSIDNENDIADRLYKQWQSLSPSLSHVKKFSYDINLSKYAPFTKWSGIQLLDGKNEKELLKVDRLLTEDMISFSSLLKSTTVTGNSIYYVNYGRQEDFAYLIKHNIPFGNSETSIVVMRRQQTIISQTEQIHQALYHGFGAIIFFDDNKDSQTTETTDTRQNFFREWVRQYGRQNGQNLIDGIINNRDHSIAVLMLSYNDIQSIFASLQPDSNDWLLCPSEWHNKTTSLKIGGTLSTVKLRIVVNMEEAKIQLPVVMSSIHGKTDGENFIMIGYQLNSVQQNRIVNEIIQAYINQIKNGWKPKRSVLFCAWSGLDYDHYTIHQWISNNYHLVDMNLLAYIDLGNDITGNSTLNLHGSSLLEQVAYRAANYIPSPIKHNHTCHQRQMPTTMPTGSNEESHHHEHSRKRRNAEHEHHMDMDMNNEDENEKENECESHKLLDEWIRAARNQMGSNKSIGIVQPIDIDSSAALFQLKYGIPSIVIEITDEQAVTNDTFYVRHPPTISDREISPEFFVVYTQFISEIIRQLIDEPLIAFNLTNYAEQIDKQAIDYFAHYGRAYNALYFHIGRPEEFTKLLNDLTKSIRQLQTRIDQIPKNDYVGLQSLNKQLFEFERLFISNDQLYGMNSADKSYKHILFGPAYSLTNTAVPFPLLSNVLFEIPEDPSSEICYASALYWSKLKKHLYLINRTLNGFDGLLTNDK